MRGNASHREAMSDVEELVKREPWRLGAGQPLNAQDPTWTAERSERCGGDIEYTAGKWWFCKKCGCCGDHDFAKAHRAINDPVVYFMQSVKDYVARRMEEGVPRGLAEYQMFHVAGVAIRYASSVKSEELGAYVQQLIVR